MSSLLFDLKYAVRSLRRSPGYVAVALVTLALGIGANTAAFSVLRGVLLRPLPYEEPDELVRVWELNKDGRSMQAAWPNYRDWRYAESFDGLAAYGAWTSTLLGGDEAMRVPAAPITAEFFDVMRARPLLGRLTRPDEHAQGAAPAVVVSERFWRDHMDATTDLGSRTFQIATYTVQVVGVLPAAFDFPAGSDIWYPLELAEPNLNRTAHNHSVIGRLADGVTAERAKAELDRITEGFLLEDPGALESEYAAFFPAASRVEPLMDVTIGDARRPLWILLSAAALLLLVACTNLASTALARGTLREREVAVRLSLGGKRGVVARLLFVESLLLSLAGGVLGLALAAALIRLLPALAADGVPRLADIRLDGTVLLFTLVASVLTAVIFGLMPALRSAGRDLGTVLRTASRGSSAGGRERVWSALVIAEVGLALLLLVGAGLLIRSFGTVLSTDPGFRTEGVLLATVTPPPGEYGDIEVRKRYYERLVAEVESLPGVAGVGFASVSPLSGLSNGLVDIEGGPEANATGYYQVATADYFRALDIPLLRGRLFQPTDLPESEHVVIVNEAFAALAWPGEDPIGKRMTSGGMDNFWEDQVWARVIGVVGDTRQISLTREPPPTYFFPLSQRPFRTWSGTLIVRPLAGEAAALTASVRDVVRRLDSDVPTAFSTMEERLAGSVTDRRFTMLLLGGFAAIGLLLAVVGIYGVVSYSVARRTREMGIRIALGARPASVRGLVQGRVMILAAAGIAIGTLAALAGTRIMASLLYEVSPADPVTFLGVALLMAATAFVAGWVPALRTSRVDPIVTMQSE